MEFEPAGSATNLMVAMTVEHRTKCADGRFAPKGVAVKTQVSNLATGGIDQNDHVWATHSQ